MCSNFSERRIIIKYLITFQLRIAPLLRKDIRVIANIGTLGGWSERRQNDENCEGYFFFFKRRVNISLQNEFYESLIVPIILFCKNNDINLIYGRYQISFFTRLSMSYVGGV